MKNDIYKNYTIIKINNYKTYYNYKNQQLKKMTIIFTCTIKYKKNTIIQLYNLLNINTIIQQFMDAEYEGPAATLLCGKTIWAWTKR